MPYELIPHATSEDSTGLGRNNTEAFIEETWWRMLFPSFTTEERIERTQNRMFHRLQQDRDTYRHQIVKETDTGEVVGYARWVLPESASNEWLEAQVPKATPEKLEEYKNLYDSVIWITERPELDRLDEWITEQREILTPKEPFIKLDFLAVGPKHKGKGIASMLVQSGAQAASKLKMPIFFVAMGHKARNMYLKNGCIELSSKVQDLRPYGEEDVYETYMMIKHPDTTA